MNIAPSFCPSSCTQATSLRCTFLNRRAFLGRASSPLLVYEPVAAAGLQRRSRKRRSELDCVWRIACNPDGDQHPSQDMAGNVDNVSIYSLRNCKIVHLVRHAQGFHNVVGENDHAAYLSYDYVDATITPLGYKQVHELRKYVKSINLTEKIELVVTSPLMRTMQTAVGVFGGPHHTASDPSPPLMVANSGGSSQPAISSTGCPPFMAVELCREHIGVHPCDKRQSVSTYRNIFPGIDFSQVERDEDTLWEPDVRESDEDLIARGKMFLEWLSMRKEREIAVVSHSGFLTHLLSVFGQGCSTAVQKELRKGFTNCEMRSIVLVNQRDVGPPIPEDYLGGNPSGKDAPSDTVGNEVAINGQ